MTSVAAEIAVSYWDGDEFFPLLKIEPGFYYTRDYITENSFDIPIRVAFGLKVLKQVHLVLGFSADRFQQIPIFPVAGFNWQINDKLNLRAVFPEPRFSYTPNDSVEFFLAGQYAGGDLSERTNKRYSDERERSWNIQKFGRKPALVTQ